MLERIGVVLSLSISVVSMVIAILSYRLKAPKIRIQILDKGFSGFFGNVLCEHNDHIRKSRISGVRLRLINNSPSEISIMDIVLKCNKETYRLIDCTIDYWESVEFIFPDANGETTSDGTAIDYEDEGVTLPLNLKAYEGKDFVALFYHFPANIKKQVMAKVIVHTTVGAKTKRVNLRECNKYTNDDYEDFLQYLRSIEADEKQ